MVATKVLSLLALAASTLAAPAPHGRGHKKVVWHTVIETAYVTVPYGYTPPKTSSSSKPEPVVSTIYYTPAPPAPTSTKEPSSSAYVPPPPPPSSTTPTPTPSPSSPPATGYMAVVDEWRAKLGLEKLTVSSKLESNAADAAGSGGSYGTMHHKLNDGSFGQVLAPGSKDEFEHCFVGGWLCEMPNMAGMNGICATASDGWYYTSTGHAELLTDPKYKTIGCGWNNGVWACDLGF